MNKINRLEVKQLRILLALLREKNVSNVANQVGLTQQAVSDQLRKLRDIFDDRLFIRSAQGLVPTAFALGLEGQIQDILKGIETLLAPEEFNPAKVTGSYTISATDYAQKLILPQLLCDIRNKAPHLKIIIRDFEIEGLNELMINDRVNLALAFPSYVPESYPSVKLFSEHHICVASNQSHLAGRELSLSDVAQEPQIVVSVSSSNLKNSVDTWFENAGLQRNVVISVPCFSVVPGYIESTDAISFLPSKSKLNDNMVKLKIIEPPIEFDVIAAWHARSNQDKLHNWVVGLLKKQYSID